MKIKFSYFQSQAFSQEGQTLLEVLIALGIIAVVMGAVGGVITSSLTNAQAIKKKTLATKLAQEGLEAIRELRNSNYTQFRSYSEAYCLDTIPAVLNKRTSFCTKPNVGEFIRTVTIQQAACQATIASVQVTVSWSDKECSSTNPYCHSATHDSCLSTTNPIQAP